MDSFRVEGNHSLKGAITPQGAKNEALQVICATLLTDESITISNVPDISDVNLLIAILQKLGVEVNKIKSGSYSFQAKKIDLSFLSTEEYSGKTAKLRGAIMMMGPLLARFRKVQLARPGGDQIGRRRLDTHFLGFEQLGAQFKFNAAENSFFIEAKKLKGNNILLEEASVTGTANLIMASVLAEGTTTIFNAACEPYIQQLCSMLIAMGANIEGIGSNLLKINGVRRLHACQHKCLSDMIEVGSFIGLAAMTQSEITIKNAQPQHLGIIPSTFRKLGIQLEVEGEDIFIPKQKNYTIQSFIDGSIMTIADAPWPGLTPDLLSVILVVATQAKGTVLIHQKMFESRLFFVDKLIDMGAKIILCDPHRAAVIGMNREQTLRGIEMVSPDIRAGVALLIAALSAKGISIIHNINQIDRGYERIDERLQKIGARITRM